MPDREAVLPDRHDTSHFETLDYHAHVAGRIYIITIVLWYFIFSCLVIGFCHIQPALSPMFTNVSDGSMLSADPLSNAVCVTHSSRYRGALVMIDMPSQVLVDIRKSLDHMYTMQGAENRCQSSVLLFCRSDTVQAWSISLYSRA
ncbi:hypothetical protein AcV7_005041 [Taiwanofungus camphoratus]|nr:hypothetical protein AcV7_005041 [Antrodia cinnamomea]